MGFYRILMMVPTTSTAEGAESAGSSMLPMLLMLAAVFAVFYFMMIRPENKRKKEAEELRAALKKGDVITTIGGIVGTIVSVKDDDIVIETSEDQVRMQLKKWAVNTNNTAEADKKKRQDDAKAEAKRRAEEKAKDHTFSIQSFSGGGCSWHFSGQLFVCSG